MSTLYSIPLYKSSSLYQLSRINNTVYGIDPELASFLEVDLKHSIVWTHPIPQTSITPILECKYIENCWFGAVDKQATKEGYLCVFDKTVQRVSFYEHLKQTNRNKTKTFSSSNILASNSMAAFTGEIDAYQNTIVFAKLHENHLKYSINWMEGIEREKKIIKLLDFDPKSLIINRHSPQIIYTDPQNHAKYFDINKPEIETTLVKKSVLLFDTNFLYCTSSNLVSKFNDVYEIQTIDLKMGKYAFSFKGNGLPRKIQSYGNFVFYMTGAAMEVYDKRKGDVMLSVGVGQEERIRTAEDLESLRQFGRYAERRVNDFLLEPNLGKIYLSMSNELRVLDFSFF